MATRFTDHTGTGTASARPAASAVPQGYIYFATDTRVTSKSDGVSTWTTVMPMPGVLDVDTQTGTTYTLVLADAGKMVTLSNAGSITLTVPTNASVAFDVGTTILLVQLGAGQVTVAGSGGVTVNSRGAALKIAGQYGAATLVKTATDTWVLTGDIST